MRLKNFFKHLLTAGLALTITFGLTGCGTNTATSQTSITIATGNTSGTYYPIGKAIAEIVNQNVEGVKADVQSTSGSLANISLMQEGTAQIAIVQNDMLYYAVTGTNNFDKKVEHIMGIASLYPETCQFVTTAESGINSIEDLRGKRVAVGSVGSGAESNVRQILQAYGMTYDDIDEEFFSFSESKEALENGLIDVAFITAGYPTPAVEEIANVKNIKLIPLDEDKIIELTKNYPFYAQTNIPAGTYGGVYEYVPTVSVMAILVATDKIDENTAYKMTRAIFNNTDKLKAAHKSAQFISKETALKGMGFIQMNEGAEKFLKEN